MTSPPVRGVCAQSSPRLAVGRKQHPSARSSMSWRGGADSGAKRPGLRHLHAQPHAEGQAHLWAQRGWERETPRLPEHLCEQRCLPVPVLPLQL